MREALKAGLPLDRVLIARGAAGPRLQEIIELCRERDIPVRFEPRAQLDRAATNHQGVVAFGAAARTTTLEQAAAGQGLIVLLDGIEDPQATWGAIIRTAHAAGASAVVIPERRAAGLTETVSRSAAGALAHIPVVRVANINRALEAIRDGYLTYGLDERGPFKPHDQSEYTAPMAFVIGAEGRGPYEHTAKRCDFLIRIPDACRRGCFAERQRRRGSGSTEWRRRLTSKRGRAYLHNGCPSRSRSATVFPRVVTPASD